MIDEMISIVCRFSIALIVHCSRLSGFFLVPFTRRNWPLSVFGFISPTNYFSSFFVSMARAHTPQIVSFNVLTRLLSRSSSKVYWHGINEISTTSTNETKCIYRTRQWHWAKSYSSNTANTSKYQLLLLMVREHESVYFLRFRLRCYFPEMLSMSQSFNVLLCIGNLSR